MKRGLSRYSYLIIVLILVVAVGATVLQNNLGGGVQFSPYDEISNYGEMIYASEDGMYMHDSVYRDGTMYMSNSVYGEANIPKTKGYIVELKQEPIAVKKVQAENSGRRGTQLDSEIESQESLIQQEHSSFLDKLGGEIMMSPGEGESEGIVLSEYKNVFNGFVLDVSAQEIVSIKNFPEVKSVSPNYEVHATLMDSVSQIQDGIPAGQLDRKGNDCMVSGEECLTGRGVTIGIIDTGVDYTHGDLGGSGFTELRKYTKISDGRFSNYPFFTTQQISLAEGRLAYTTSNKIKIYDFDTEEVLEISPFTSGLDIVRLDFDGSILAYYATNPSLGIAKDASIYYYNLNTDEHREIESSISHVNRIFTSEGKIIYEKTVDVGGEVGRSNIYVYNTLTGEKNTIAEDSIYAYYPWVSNNLVAYSVNSEDCFEKLVVYNMDTKQDEDYFLENVGPVLSFKDKEIIYNDCDPNNYDPSWNAISLYNLETREKIVLRNFEGNIGTESLIFSTPSSSIGNDLYYFSKSGLYGQIIAYDKKLDRFVEVNPVKSSGDIAAEGNKICFVSSDDEIYCHDYDQDYGYPLQPVQFNSKVVGGYDFVNNDDNPMDDHGHGTHVAATAAGNGALKGVAPEAEIYAYKVLDSGGGGWDSDIIAAIERSIDPNQDGDFSDHLDIISLSLGGMGNPDDPMSKAIDNAVSNGVVAVVAAGNSGPNEQTIGSPGTARDAITVGAVDKSDNIAGFSSRGPVVWTDIEGNEKAIIKPDVVAPGVDICSAQWDSAWEESSCLGDGEHTAISGTSMATPHVAGAVALLLQKNPNWTPEEIKAALKGTAVDLGLKSLGQGNGRIDVLEAVKLDNPPEMPWDFYVYFKNPVNNVHDIVEIKGVFPEDYDSLTVQYQRPGEVILNTDGVEIVGKGSTIARFDPEGRISGDGEFFFKVSITKGGDEKGGAYYVTRFDKSIKKNWPKKIHFSSLAFLDQPTIADIDGDLSKEIIFTYTSEGYYDPNLLIYNYEGQIVDLLGLPFSSSQFGSLLGDYDRNGNPDLLFITSFASQGYARYLNVYDLVSKDYISFPTDSSGFGTIKSFDLDGDNFNEVAFTDWDNYLFIYRDIFNSDYSKIPLFGPEDCMEGGWGPCPGMYSSEPFFLDVDGDKELEIVLISGFQKNENSKFYAFDIDGSLVEGFPKVHDSYFDCRFQGIIKGKNQLLCMELDKNFDPNNLNFVLIDNELNMKKSVEAINASSLIGSTKPAVRGLAFGDFEGEDYVVLILRDNAQYRNFVSFVSMEDFSVKKTYEFPVLYNSIIYPVGNLGDKNYVFAGSTWAGDNYFVNFAGDNLVLRGSGHSQSQIISDVDGDELNELISVDRDGYVYVRDFEGNVGKEWGEFYYDSQHTGCYDCDKKPETTCYWPPTIRTESEYNKKFEEATMIGGEKWMGKAKHNELSEIKHIVEHNVVSTYTDPTLLCQDGHWYYSKNQHVYYIYDDLNLEGIENPSRESWGAYVSKPTDTFGDWQIVSDSAWGNKWVDSLCQGNIDCSQFDYDEVGCSYFEGYGLCEFTDNGPDNPSWCNPLGNVNCKDLDSFACQEIEDLYGMCSWTGGSGDSCEGYCGSQAPDGCWCDDLCSGYGDCCEDYDVVCTLPQLESCYEVQAGPFCNDPVGCFDTMCGIDPYCCETQWDSICAGEAVDFC